MSGYISNSWEIVFAGNIWTGITTGGINTLYSPDGNSGVSAVFATYLFER